MPKGQLILILAAHAGQYRRAAEALDVTIKAIEACDPTPDVPTKETPVAGLFAPGTEQPK